MARRKKKNNSVTTTEQGDVQMSVDQNDTITEGTEETTTAEETTVVDETVIDTVIDDTVKEEETLVIEPTVEPVVEKVIAPVVTPEVKPTETVIVEDNSFEGKLKKELDARVAFFKKTTLLSKQQLNQAQVELASIAIRVHNSSSVKALQMYLDYMSNYPEQITNIVVPMDTVIKNNNRERNSVSMMQTAFVKIATATRRNKKIELVAKPVQTDIINRTVVNFILSKLG